MDARPALYALAKAMNEQGLEAILIGNAAAALHGAPVTTIDFDFLFRKTPRNLQKLKAIAKDLHATILRPYYPASGLFRLVRDEDGLQADYMSVIDGIKSFEALRSESSKVNFGDYAILVANLAAVLASKQAAGRPSDKAVLDILKRTLNEEQAGEKESSAEGQAIQAKPRRGSRRPKGGK